MKLRDDVEEICSGDFWYDLFDGGYLNPDEIVVPEAASKVWDAIEVLREFRDTIMNSDKWLEM